MFLKSVASASSLSAPTSGYQLNDFVKVKRPQARGEAPRAGRAEAPPAPVPAPMAEPATLIS
jgi:hypothetical protein